MIGYAGRSKHLSYRLAFKLHCFHFVMGYPAFNSLAKSVRLGFWIYFYPTHSLPWVQNKVAGFLPELLAPIHTQPWSGRVGELNQLLFDWKRKGTVERNPGVIIQGKVAADGGKAGLSTSQCRVSLRKQQLPRTGRAVSLGQSRTRTCTAGHRLLAGSHVSMSSNQGTEHLTHRPIRIHGRLFLKWNSKELKDEFGQWWNGWHHQSRIPIGCGGEL